MYYPLEVGNIWEYEKLPASPSSPGEVIRLEVLYDTTAKSGRAWALSRDEYVFLSPDTLATSESTCCDFKYVDADGFVVINFEERFDDLGSDWFSCYTNDDDIVTSVGLDEGDGVIDKTFSRLELRNKYEYGWGPVEIDGYVLTYARVGGVERGDSIGSRYYVVGTEDYDNGNKVSMTVYPNPSRGQFTVELTGSVPGLHTMSILDVLGREVYGDEIMVGNGGAVRRVSIGTGGVYIVRLTNNHGTSIELVTVSDK